MRKTASIAAIVFGVLLILAAGTTWFVVSDTLRAQNITVAEDGCLHGRTVVGPFTAYCQAKIIDEHTLEITDGKTYAELDREDPLRQTAMNSAFLQASLFTSVLAFGVSVMAAGMGVLFILIGLGMRDVSQLAEPERSTR
ncbi:MAG: aromatic ring-opening dioxygenase LigA [Acidimicrobiia bacterium]